MESVKCRTEAAATRNEVESERVSTGETDT